MSEGYITILFGKSQYGKNIFKLWWEGNNENQNFTAGYEYENTIVKGIDNYIVSKPVYGKSEKDAVYKLLEDKNSNNFIFQDSNSCINLLSIKHLYDFCKKQKHAYSFTCHFE